MMPPDTLVALTEVNEAFYRAFQERDIDGMARVWGPGPDVYCVHPAQTAVRGAASVLESWRETFTRLAAIEIMLTDVHCRPAGQVGVVTCQENLLFAWHGHAQQQPRTLVTTNLYTMLDGSWRMIGHHASPVVPPSEADVTP